MQPEHANILRAWQAPQSLRFLSFLFDFRVRSQLQSTLYYLETESQQQIDKCNINNIYISTVMRKYNIGKPQLRPPRCDTRVTPEEKRSFLARRAQETEQRRALFNAEADAETT